MERTLKTLAKEAKQRMKKGFWKECEEKLDSERNHAKEQGINESKMERYFQQKVETQIRGQAPDEFYLKVRDMLLSEGEVSPRPRTVQAGVRIRDQGQKMTAARRAYRARRARKNSERVVFFPRV